MYDGKSLHKSDEIGPFWSDSAQYCDLTFKLKYCKIGICDLGIFHDFLFRKANIEG